MTLSKINSFIGKVDKLQQSRRSLSFIYAVVRKYSDDSASYQAALVAFYGFLSLFPLLIVLTSTLELLSATSHVREKILNSVTIYFPVIGDQIQRNIYTPHRSGIALALGVLITLYGARGVADILRNSLDKIWRNPRRVRSGFPTGLYKSVGIILISGAAIISSGLLSGFATTLGRATIYRSIATIISIAIIFLAVLIVFRIGVSGNKLRMKHLWVGALFAAITLQILQIFGGYIITHELRHLSTLYGTFSFVLGLIFWIFLQSQIIIYAMEIDSVRVTKLWPRKIRG